MVPRSEIQDGRVYRITVFVVQIIMSLIILTVGLKVILSGDYDDGTKKWAFAAVGTVIGYWLR